MENFKLAPEFEKSSLFVMDFELCQLRLNIDGEVDWLILIPRKEGMKDWSDLSLEDQYQLTREIDHVSKSLKAELNPDKINVASLGNMVPQLHIHVMARYKTDRAWPGAIFGVPENKESSAKFDGARVSFWKEKLK